MDLLFWELITQAPDWVNQFLQQYQYAGIFFLAFIGAVSIFVPIPYTVVIFSLGTTFNPIFVALAAGFGSALGEFSGYALGAYGAKKISKEKRRKMEFMAKVFNKWGAIAIFVFALTPLPDDLLFIPLGIVRYSVAKAFVFALTGKITMNLILAYSGGIVKEVLFGGESEIVAIVLTGLLGGVLLIIILMIMFRLDWEKIYYKYVEKRNEK